MSVRLVYFAWVRERIGKPDETLELPGEVNKATTELKTMPTQAGLDALAKKLAQRQWNDPALAQERLAEQLRNEPQDRPLTAERLRELRDRPPTANVPSSASSYSPAILAAVPKGETSRPTIPFQAVRVEIWKYEMPAGTCDLKQRTLFTVTVPAPATEAAR